MQFTTPIQQLTTCPQCDNVVRIDAEFCNICGKRLRPASSSPYLSPAQQEEADDEDEYEDDENDEQEFSAPTLAAHHTARSHSLPPSTSEILSQLRRLQAQTDQMERYFPADLPDKARKLAAWKKQISRALVCIELCERPQLQQTNSQQPLKLRHHIAEATRALDFTREYSVKLIGHAGAGKSTLLAAFIGQDIFPRLAGGAVTGVCTRVRLCSEQESEEMRVHFLTRSTFDTLLKKTQKSIKEAPDSQTREALARDLAILLTARGACR